VIYVNGSYSRSVKSVTGLINMLISGFSGAIEYKKEWSTNRVVILWRGKKLSTYREQERRIGVRIKTRPLKEGINGIDYIKP